MSAWILPGEPPDKGSDPPPGPHGIEWFPTEDMVRRFVSGALASGRLRRYKNDEERIERVVERFRKQEPVDPFVIVLHIDERKGADYIDGSHRLRAAEIAGVTSVPVAIYFSDTSPMYFEIGQDIEGNSDIIPLPHDWKERGRAYVLGKGAV